MRACVRCVLQFVLECPGVGVTACFVLLCARVRACVRVCVFCVSGTTKEMLSPTPLDASLALVKQQGA